MTGIKFDNFQHTEILDLIKISYNVNIDPNKMFL